ncbi:MAG TPA: efflux RND transporter periplasmic adaptor subunit [Polyangiaceae bacterium]|nr:efflux RND transporter periplasmic adaptor subunit [Polyangiaceae bacterium]
MGFRGAVGGLAMVLLAASSLGCHRAPAESAPARPAHSPDEAWLTQAQVEAAHVVVERAQVRDVGGTLATAGRVTFDDLLVTHVYSPVSGRVTRVDAALGQAVRKGDPLATIDSPDLGSVEADLAKAEADVFQAHRDFVRKRELVEAHAVARADFEVAEENDRKAKAELRRARLKSRMLHVSPDAARAGGETFVLRSPIAGTVIARAISPGIQVAGVLSGGTPTEFFTIGELRRVWVLADVYEQDLAAIRKGARVEVSVVAWPGRTFVGAVDWVASALDPQLRTARVRCEIDNPDALLKPEMYATATISVPKRRALAVPADAILHLGDQTVLFVQLPDGPAGEKRFERRPVKLAENASGPWLAVERGLSPGDPVVVSGAILLSGAM